MLNIQNILLKKKIITIKVPVGKKVPLISITKLETNKIFLKII